MAGGSAERRADGPPEAADAVSARVRRPLLAAALLLAACNILFGLLFRRDGESVADFMQLLQWSGEWLRGSNPYAPPHSLADYPPNALVSLAPLAAIALNHAAALWTLLHLVLSAAAAAMAARLAPFGRNALLFGALVLALPAFRTVMQFSLASFVPALSGFLAADRYPRLAGVAIGVSLLKPHIGGPVLLWAIASRRWRTVYPALAVPAALFAVYLARARQGPLQAVAEWLAAAARTQNRADLVGGETSLLPVMPATLLSPTTAQAVIALLLGAGLAVIWHRRGRDVDLRFLAAACLLSLLSFRHLSYNLLLAIPALAWTLTDARRAVRMTGIAAAAVLAASPPTLWRHVLEPAGAWSGFEPPMTHAYRLALTALFVAVVAARRVEAAPASAG